jgi:hypothetical protein
MFKPAYAMASVAQTIQHQMTGWLMNELERVWKEA